MKLILPFIICMFVWKTNLFAQYPPNLPQQDCIHAIPVCDSVIYESNSYSGDGNILAEIDSLTSCLGRSEQNGAWYLLHVLEAGDICFTITPDSFQQDIDWAVFNLTEASCEDIKTDPSLEVACNFITNAGPCNGITGADGATSGICGFQHAPCIPAQQGESYLLYVSSYTEFNGGYTIDFSASSATLFDNNPLTLESRIILPELKQLHLTFSKPISCQNLKTSSFSFGGTSQNYQILNLYSDDCEVGSDYESTFVLNLQSPIDLNELGLLDIQVNDTLHEMCGQKSSGLSASVLLEIEILAQPDLDTLCSNEELELGTNLPAGTNLSTEWEPGMLVSPIYFPDLSAASVFTANVYASNGLLLGSSSREFEILPGPVVSVGNDTSICGPDTLQLNAKGSFDQLVWSTNSTDDTLAINQEGLYWVEAINDNGCLARDSIRLDILSEPVADFDIEGTGNTLTLIAKCGDCTSFLWEISDGTTGAGMEVQHTFSQSGQFFITLIVSNECGSDTLVRTLFIDLTSLDPNSWEGNIQLYPNPASDQLFLHSFLHMPAQVSLINPQGQRVFEQHVLPESSLRWNISELSRGLYICEVRTKGSRFIRKVLID